MKYKKLLNSIVLLLAVCLAFSGCIGTTAPETTESQELFVTITDVPDVSAEIAETQAASEEADETHAVPVEAAETQPSCAVGEETGNDAGARTISVAVYPYIPDIELFMEILTRQWEALESDVELVYVSWDCYEDPEPDQIDILMYDAMFTTYLAENGHIQPIREEDLQDRDGILPFAVEGAYHNGKLYGVPYLVCSDFLVHRTDDAEMASVRNMKELSELFRVRKQKNPTDGLAVKYYSHYPYYYLDALIDFSGEYTVYEEAPVTATPDPLVCARLDEIERCLPGNVEQEDLMKDSRRCALFNDGICSAYYGYSEDMSRMDDVQDEISVRTLSFSETENIQMFFADIVSMGAHVSDPVQQELCIRLMNLIGSEKFQQELCFGTEDVQYMLPARRDVYALAQEKYPLYGQLFALVTDEQNRIARFGKDIHTYLSVAYEDLA